ncbi:MAG: TrbG/VirB9 family P-type conjugative transfer protein [Proteobacteria bacterium]|nr:TrbG/VirB9 family P-type conjugative transfer protein [Pseudomonadota bacterium]
MIISAKHIFKNILKFGVLMLAGLILVSKASYSSQAPRFLGSEKKFRAYLYNPNAVYRYIGHYYYQGEVIFENDETINTVSMGNPSLWLFERLGNTLYLKPIEDNAETNMTVQTNKRTYHFELTAREATSIDDENLIFVVKFIYPDGENKNIMKFPKKPISDAPDMRDLSIYNFNYEFTGQPVIAPIKVFDNGEFTYFQFSHKNAEIPAIFHVDSDGFESLVNFRVADDFIIVERVSAQFTLRNGNDIVCVYNSNMIRAGQPLTDVGDNPARLNVAPNSTPDFERRSTY